MKTFIAIIVHIMAFVFSFQLQAETSVAIQTNHVYEVAALGYPIGTIDVVRQQKMAGDTPVHHQSVVVALEFEDNGKAYSIFMDSEIAYDGIGLREYTHHIRENDKHYQITGRRVEDKLWLRAEQIRTKAQEDDKAIIDTAVGVASQAVPYLDLLTGLVNSDSDGSIVISMAEFDVSSDEFLDQLSSSNTGTSERYYRVLNTDTLEIELTAVSELGEDSVSVGEKDIPCLVVHIDSENHTRTACIARDVLGGYFVSESGSDEDGSYSIRLIH